MHPRAHPIDRNVMREINQNMLLNLIRTHAPVSRTQLKKLSGLSLGTIVGITSALIERELVVETGVAESTGGRKAGLLEIYPDGGYVLGVDLREHEITGAMLNLHGNVVYAESWPAPLRNNAAQAVDVIATGVETFIAHTEVTRDKILGLGCGVSGPVNSRTGVNVDSWILNWHKVELSNPLSERLEMPVFVDNEVNCFASYEKLYGNGQKYHNFLLVTLGRGLGMATVIRDDLFRGAEGMGAEFGHIPFDVNGRRCECGNWGCLEAYVSDHGIFTTYRELCGDPIDVKAGDVDTKDVNALFKRGQEGDERALKAFKLTGAHLGIGLATLVNLLNPECIILNGGEGLWIDLLIEPMKETMNRHIFSQLGRNLDLIIERGITRVNWARGAGCLVLRDFFASQTQS
ncbi:MAG TPA: ROK family protein [Ktedonobacteraceae bacterium]|nr:ROK family protein [Ktedonobacteraceae bacterium]